MSSGEQFDSIHICNSKVLAIKNNAYLFFSIHHLKWQEKDIWRTSFRLFKSWHSQKCPPVNWSMYDCVEWCDIGTLTGHGTYWHKRGRGKHRDMVSQTPGLLQATTRRVLKFIKSCWNIQRSYKGFVYRYRCRTL